MISMTSFPGLQHTRIAGTDVREIRLARLDKTRPVVVLTRDAVRPVMTKVTVAPVMTKVTVAPVTSTVKGLSSEGPVGPGNGLDHEVAVSLDNVLTIPSPSLGRLVGYLTDGEEKLLAVTVAHAYDLDIPLTR